MEILDISMEIEPGMLMYPNNPRPVIQEYARIPEDITTESRITLGSHTGTHVDAPLHVLERGKNSSELPLGDFFGRCTVIDLTWSGKAITASALEECDIQKGDIILLKTENALHQYQMFREDFAHVTMDAAHYLIERGIKTLGIDYLSVKKFGGDDDVHKLLISNLTLIEGLVLTAVAAGNYTFIGFPLSIKCDGAPLRAVLVKE